MHKKTKTSPQLIFFTGGHITPALAVVDELRARGDEYTFLCIGRQFTDAHQHDASFEYQEVASRNIPFVDIGAVRFPRDFSPAVFRFVVRMAHSIFRAYQLLRTKRPTYVLSFGGYIAFPVAVACFLCRTPLYTHEQTVRPGLANRAIAHLARRVYVSFPEAARYFPSNKTIISGNPVRRLFLSQNKDPSHPTHENRKTPIIYVTGGSLGAHQINVLIEDILPELLQYAQVIHQTGNVSEFGDYERLLSVRASLPEGLRARYDLRAHVSDADLDQTIRRCDLIISRSGANTFFEIIALRKRSVLIPLPWASFDEQTIHANILKDYGVAEILPQSASSQDLLRIIRETLLIKPGDLASRFDTLNARYNTQGAQYIADDLA